MKNICCLLSGLFVLFCAAQAYGACSDAANTYFLPFYTSMNDTWTGVAFTNEGGATANICLDVYQQSGNHADSIEDIVAPNGQTSFVIINDEQFEGWVKVSSSEKLSGLCFFGKSSIPNYMADISLIDTATKTLRIPHIDQSDYWDSVLKIANTFSASNNVVVAGFDAQGNIVDEKEYTIPGHGSIVIPITDISPFNFQNIKSVLINAAYDIAAFSLYKNQKVDGYCYSGISATPTNVLPTNKILLKNYYIIYTGYHTYNSGFKDRFVLSNLSGIAGSVYSQEVTVNNIPAGGFIVKYDSSDQLLIYGRKFGDGTYCVMNPPVTLPQNVNMQQKYTYYAETTYYSSSGSVTSYGSDEITIEFRGPEETTVFSGTYTTYNMFATDKWTNGANSGTAYYGYYLAQDTGPVKIYLNIPDYYGTIELVTY